MPPLFCAWEQSLHLQHFIIASARFTISHMHKEILLLLSVLLFPSFASAQQQPTNQLDVPSLLREVEAKQKKNAAKAQPYSYTLKRTMQDLNNKGEVKKEKVYLYQVFPIRHGLPAMLLLSEDGKPLSVGKLAKEKVKTNKYWQEHKNDVAKNEPAKNSRGSQRPIILSLVTTVTKAAT